MMEKQRPLSIMIFSPGYPPYKIGGEEYYSYYQNKYYSKFGHKVLIVTYETRKKTLFDRAGKYLFRISRINYVIHKFLSFLHLFFRGMFNINFKPDIIQSHDPYVEGICACIIGRILKKPVITTWHGAEFFENNTSFSSLGNLCRKFVCSNSKLIIVPSIYVKNKIIRNMHLNSNKIKIISNGVDTDFFKNRNDEYSVKIKNKYNLISSPIILSVSRLNEIKRIDMLIKSISLIKNKYEDIKLIVVGDGPEKNNLINLTNDLNLRNNVIFVGYVARSELPTYYSLCDVFVLPTKGEGFGLVYMEAWSCEKPIIATKYAPLIAKLIHEKGGGVVINNAEKELSFYIDQLLSDKNMRIKMGIEGRTIVENWYTWDIVFRKYIEHYFNILLGK